MEERKCKECGEIFIIAAGEKKWLVERGLAMPKRCKRCRDARKAAKQQQAADTLI